MFENKLAIFVVGLLAWVVTPVADATEYPVVPAGVKIAVQLQEPVNSETAEAGSTFMANLTAPVESGGETLIPAGAEAKVALVIDPHFAADDARVFAVELNSIRVDGHWYPVTTGFAELESGVRTVTSGPDKEVPSGVTDVNAIISAPAYGEDAALATVRGAGVSFHILHGPKVTADSGITVYFTLAEFLNVRPESRLR